LGAELFLAVVKAKFKPMNQLFLLTFCFSRDMLKITSYPHKNLIETVAIAKLTEADWVRVKKGKGSPCMLLLLLFLLLVLLSPTTQ
jgi:hypothetical protein